MARFPVLALILTVPALIAGAYLRFSGFLYMAQVMYDVLVFLVLIATLCSAGLAACRYRKRRSASVFIHPATYAVAGLILVGLAYETERGYLERNLRYMERVAQVVIEYERTHGSVPEQFETAHRATGIVLPNRGDADGSLSWYRKDGDHAFSVGSHMDSRITVEYHNGTLRRGWTP